MSLNLPVLAQSRWLRFGVFSAYYMMQGLPVGLTFIALPAWLTAQGLSKESIATFASITALPWALKLIVGPFMDRYSFLPMGMRRPWILGAQCLLLVTSCLMFFIADPLNQFWWLIGICTAMNVFASSEDVAVDGLAIAIIPEKERGRANAFMGSGQVVGISITSAVSVSLLNFGGAQAVGVYLVSVIGVLITISIVVRERVGERLLPWSEGKANPDVMPPEGSIFTLFRDLVKALLQPMSLVVMAAVFLHRINYGIYKIWAPELAINGFGYTDAQYAHWNSIILLIVAFLALAFGPVIDKIGVGRAYGYALLIGVIVYLCLFPAVQFVVHPKIAIGMMFILELTDILLFITFIAAGMSLCRVKISSTQFACYMAFSNLGMSAGSALYPALFYVSGLTQMFLVIAGFYAISWLLMTRFDLKKHKLDLAKLESIEGGN